MASSSQLDLEPSSNVISQKVSNLLSMSFGDSSLKLALEALETRIPENHVDSRRNLRSTVEQEVIKSSGLILKDFSNIATKLQELGNSVDLLNQYHAQMQEKIGNASKGNAQLIQQSAKLHNEQIAIDTKLTVLEAFETKFVVSPEEVEILSSTGLPVDDAFFDTLEKVKGIYQDCTVLLTGESQANAGENLMSTMTKYLDRGYEKLGFYAEQSFRASLQGQSNMRVDKQIRRVLIVLTERPSIFENALAGLCEVRQKSLNLEFVRALTEETSMGNKPIDFYAYDVVRYIGDIMAWIHSAVVGEKENLDALFETDRLKEGLESEPWVRPVVISDIIANQVNKITSTLVKPLRIRVERAISTQTRVTTIYQVLNMLKFYQNTFAKNFTNSEEGDVAVLSAITGLQEIVMRQFNRCLENKINNVKQSKLDSVSASHDMQPPDFLFDAMGDLKAILTSYETSISYAPGEDLDVSSKQAIQDLVEGYLECCLRIASDLPDGSAEVFTINCYDTVLVTLLLFSFTTFKVDQLEKRIIELKEALTQRQFYQFQRESGLATAKLDNREAVAELFLRLDDFLPNCIMTSTSQLQNLSSPSLAKEITTGACDLFISSFSEFKQKLADKYGDDEASELFPRTVEEVKVLLAMD